VDQLPLLSSIKINSIVDTTYPKLDSRISLLHYSQCSRINYNSKQALITRIINNSCSNSPSSNSRQATSNRYHQIFLMIMMSTQQQWVLQHRELLLIQDSHPDSNPQTRIRMLHLQLLLLMVQVSVEYTNLLRKLNRAVVRFLSTIKICSRMLISPRLAIAALVITTHHRLR
jgi:hypothetical protein